MTTPAPDAPLADALAAAFGPDARITAIDTLLGDASTRIYQRVHLAGAPCATAIAMRLPPDALAPSTESVKAHPGTELPFANMLRAAHARGVRVPALYADLTRAGNFTVLLEDLGDETFFARLGHTPRDAWAPYYERAVDLLCDWQRGFAERDAGCVAYGRRFDRDFLRWELDHFREWGLDAWRGPVTDAALRAELEREFDRLADDVAALPTTLVHRDWQSKNLMVLPDDTLAVIDFQDALVGPRVYDLVALLCDSYTALEPGEQRAWIGRYAARAGFDPGSTTRMFWTQALQRKLKDAGRFVFIDRVRNNPAYLEYIPQSVRYVHRALRELGDERARLAALLAQVAPDWFGAGAPA